eukprot:s687_g6.t1
MGKRAGIVLAIAVSLHKESKTRGLENSLVLQEGSTKLESQKLGDQGLGSRIGRSLRRCPADTPAPPGASAALTRARSRAARLRSELQREELWCDLLAARERHERRLCKRSGEASVSSEAHSAAIAAALVDCWRRFSSTEAPADEFVSRLHCAWPPGRGARPSRSLRRAARTRVPQCIEAILVA